MINVLHYCSKRMSKYQTIIGFFKEFSVSIYIRINSVIYLKYIEYMHIY